MSPFRPSRAARGGRCAAVVCLSLWLVLQAPVQCNTVDYTSVNHSLTRIPAEIPQDVVNVILSDNLIASVDINGNWTNIDVLNLTNNVLEEFPDLTNCSLVKLLILVQNLIAYVSPDRVDILTHVEKIDLRYNQLTHFPDVSGPSLTLSALDISDNVLTEVPRLPLLGRNLQHLAIWDNPLGGVINESAWVGYPVLTTLYLSGTGLTAFPGLGPVAATLQDIRLRRNSITEIPSDFIERFPKLEYLDMLDNDVSRLSGSVCERSRSAPCLRLRLEGNPLQCDSGLAWLKAGEEAGLIHVEGPAVCAGPDPLTGTAWADLTTGELPQQDSSGAKAAYVKQGTAYVMIVGDVCDVMAVTRVTRASSAPHCASQCLADGACVMFGYAATGGGPQNCAITRPTATAAGQDRTLFRRWYMFK